MTRKRKRKSEEKIVKKTMKKINLSQRLH